MRRFVPLFFVLVCLIFVSPIQAQASASGSYFAVIVSDLDTSLEWYQGTLGLEEVSRVSREGRFDIANLSGEGLFVELIELPSAKVRPEGRIRGAFKVGFLVYDLKGFIATLPEGMEKPEIVVDEQNGVALFQLRDPDGNVVQVMMVKE